jgi:outer membrane protein TolC
MRRAQSESRQSLLRAASLAYRETVLRAYAEVEIALGALHAQADRETQAEAAWQSAKRLAASATGQQALRLASEQQAQAATIVQLQAEMALLDARMGHQLAYVALFKALGGAPL